MNNILSTNSLTGQAQINHINLTGQSLIQGTTQSYQVKRLKRVIFDKFITPLFSNKWEVLEDNYIVIDGLQARIDRYFKETQDPDLKMYRDLLSVVVDMFTKYRYFNSIDPTYSSNKAMAQMIAMLPTVRLKPEYEIYNLILGKPQKNEFYDDIKLSKISKLIKNENMTIKKIEQLL
tara:strand:+ start:189 stop:719 length:531 start_codon:yes stop_codon:yes gene_type:complete